MEQLKKYIDRERKGETELLFKYYLKQAMFYVIIVSILEVQFLDKKHQHHWEACYKHSVLVST